MVDSKRLLERPLPLGDNLILRFATRADTDALAELNHNLHDDAPELYEIATLTREFMSDDHPLFGPENFTVVENSATGEIVSTMCLLSQVWSFGGIPFKFGRPELVGTHPDYRRRGLVRRQFEVIHALSASRQELMLGITGIPWYYRQFGYEMAMHLGGAAIAYRRDLPKRNSEQQSHHLRQATTADIPFLQECYCQASKREPYATVVPAEMWRYRLNQHPSESAGHRLWQILEDAAGQRWGYVMHASRCRKGGLDIQQVELMPGLGYLTVLPTLLHELFAIAQTLPQLDNGAAQIESLRFRLGPDHPLYHAWPQGFYHRRRPYAWFIRVPDLPAFLAHVRPALERNLSQSVAAAYSGEFRLNFFRSGLLLRLENGKLSEIAAWQPESAESGDAHFPNLSFLQLLCGRRRCGELAAEIPDCWVGNDAEVVLDALFPPYRGTPWIIE